MAQDHDHLKNKWLMEILSRLPVKSLLRFRSVSKHWKSVISSNSMRKLHCERHKSSLPLLVTIHCSQDYMTMKYDPNALYDYSITIYDLFGKVVQQWNLPIKSNYLGMNSFHSQSKLVCLRDKKGSYPYNPTTRQLFTLPDPPSHLFPPSYKKYPMHGFGYIPSKDEYICVELFNKNQEGNWVLEILTMTVVSNDNNYDQLHYNDNEWRSIEVILASTKLEGVYSSGQFACGVFYWDAIQVKENVRRYCFLSFDVETEVFSTFEWPQGHCPTFLSELLELKDELYLENVNESPPSLDLWKLCYDDNNKFWAHCWNINLESLGYEKYCPHPDKFDYKVFIKRFEYLKHYYNQPLSCNMLRKLGMLKLQDQDIEDEDKEDDYPSMFSWCPLIHTNIFTL